MAGQQPTEPFEEAVRQTVPTNAQQGQIVLTKQFKDSPTLNKFKANVCSNEADAIAKFLLWDKLLYNLSTQDGCMQNDCITITRRLLDKLQELGWTDKMLVLAIMWIDAEQQGNNEVTKWLDAKDIRVYRTEISNDVAVWCLADTLASHDEKSKEQPGSGAKVAQREQAWMASIFARIKNTCANLFTVLSNLFRALYTTVPQWWCRQCTGHNTMKGLSVEQSDKISDMQKFAVVVGGLVYVIGAVILCKWYLVPWVILFATLCSSCASMLWGLCASMLHGLCSALFSGKTWTLDEARAQMEDLYNCPEGHMINLFNANQTVLETDPVAMQKHLEYIHYAKETGAKMRFCLPQPRLQPGSWVVSCGNMWKRHVFEPCVYAGNDTHFIKGGDACSAGVAITGKKCETGRPTIFTPCKIPGAKWIDGQFYVFPPSLKGQNKVQWCNASISAHNLGNDTVGLVTQAQHDKVLAQMRRKWAKRNRAENREAANERGARAREGLPNTEANGYMASFAAGAFSAGMAVLSMVGILVRARGDNSNPAPSP